MAATVPRDRWPPSACAAPGRRRAGGRRPRRTGVPPEARRLFVHRRVPPRPSPRPLPPGCARARLVGDRVGRRGGVMGNYLSPGVFMEEVPAGSRPIEGVGTAVAGFVGFAEAGPFNEPTLVTNWSQFTERFGGFMEGGYLAHSVYGFFANGGGSAYVVRVGQNGSASASPASGNGRAVGAAPPREATVGPYRVIEAGDGGGGTSRPDIVRSEEHTSELQSPCSSYAVFCLKKKKTHLPRSQGPSGRGITPIWKRPLCSDSVTSRHAMLRIKQYAE